MKPLGDICDVPSTPVLVQTFKLGCIHVRLIAYSITYTDLSESITIRIRASPTIVENVPIKPKRFILSQRSPS
ncbi:hypothetical protein HanIR_Chr15g0757781 [Helianthus annuus]|nr:hypothetical protein HanIR_Chr15g0757781 [Helianthus annuus]